jgi:membrane protein DedA with SNARE-associated domain
MDATFAFLIDHGYSVLALWVFAEQIGLPIPAIPLLLAAGAVAGAGHMNLAAVIGIAVLAAVVADTIWYQLGRSRGGRVLGFLCRISLEPDSCVRKTENLFVKQGAKALLIAKFVPGLSTVAPPLAGIFGMKPSRFLFFNGLGALSWAGGFAMTGFVFSDQLEKAAARAAHLGGWMILILGAALAAYIAFKYFQRQRFLRQLRMAQITPEQLKEKLDRGEDIVVVDLRHSVDFETAPHTIPGALRFSPQDIERWHDRIPRDRDVVLFCS